MKIWNKITNEPWATTSDTLENIINIAKRQNANPAAIAAQLGRKLQSTYAVSVLFPFMARCSAMLIFLR